jgi:hypothetical protein
VHVLVFSGVFIERQYGAFAGVAHGQKTHDFLSKLVDGGYATPITPGALHRGRLYHVQYKPLYEAIGEPNNRHRRPASLGRFVERLMLLDAVLADRRYTWLGTERDKLAYFSELLRDDIPKTWYPHLTFGSSPDATTRYFPDKLPIGVPRGGDYRHVFLYLVTREVSADFRVFLLRHADLLKAVGEWTIRILLPRRFRKAAPLHRYAVRDAFMMPLTPHDVLELDWYFRARQGHVVNPPRDRDLDLAAARRRFAAARFDAIYRMWQEEGADALWALQAPILQEHLQRGEGRIECVELPHQYLQLTPLSAPRMRLRNRFGRQPSNRVGCPRLLHLVQPLDASEPPNTRTRTSHNS